MALSSTSTDDQIQAQIDDNAAYDELSDVAMAKAYRTALRLMIGRLKVARSVDGGTDIQTQISGYKTLFNEVESWLGVNDSDALARSAQGPIGFDFSNFRG